LNGTRLVALLQIVPVPFIIAQFRPLGVDPVHR
jgi:hypothetical protein